MTVSTPYGVTCQCFQDTQRTHLIDNELAQLRNIAPNASNLIVRVQFFVDQVADNLGPSGNLNQYTFSQVDSVVQAINNAGLICLLGFQAPTPPQTGAGSLWLNGCCPIPPDCHDMYMLPQDWAIFAGNVASHYTNNAAGLHIDIIECGNEDYNFNDGSPHCNLPDVAAHTATAVYQKVKEVNSTILVGAPATNSINNQCGDSHHPTNVCDWWKNFFLASPKADYVNYHQYPAGVSCCGGVHCYTLLEEAQYIQSLNQQILPLNVMPIWCTEIGFALGSHTCEGPGGDAIIDEVIQARLLTETMEAGRTSGGVIQTIFWYTMDYGYPNYTLARDPNTVTKAYTAFQNEVAQYPQW